MKTLGICFGATSVQCVTLQVDPEILSVVNAVRINHEGNPQKTFVSFFDTIDRYDIDRVAVTGRYFRHHIRLTSISEPQAVETALKEECKQATYPDCVISCGGETQLAYQISSSGAIVSVHSGNKCASGTGEFFLQQVRRMGLSVEEAVALANTATAYKIAGRCSVFCKSDCTHALNKGEPVEKIVAGLCSMVADKIDELVSGLPNNRMIVIGGATYNTAIMDILKRRYNEVVIPEHAAFFEAYGAALWAASNPCIDLPPEIAPLIQKSAKSFSFHPPLSTVNDLVDFKEIPTGNARAGDVCVLGLDVGSTTTKAVLMRKEDRQIIADIYLRTNGNPVEASRQCYAALNESVKDIPLTIVGLGVTGSGRQIAGLHALTDMVINEIIAHATAAAYYDAEVDTIFEIGGQDAKYTYITRGVPSDYAMNEACSAGTGSFLEESAMETLNVTTTRIGTYAISAANPPDFNDQCAAFISSDIKRAIQQGLKREDILAGLVYSICMNYLTRVKGARPVGKKIFMQGGVCYNQAVPLAMAALLKTKIIVAPQPGLMGAFGVALEVAKRLEHGLIEEKQYCLTRLMNRPATREGTFVCAGGKEKCDRKCIISRIRIDDTVFPFGGICDRYYNQRIKKEIENVDELDLVQMRQKLMFDVFGPCRPLTVDESGHRKRTVGFNHSLLMHTLYPLFSNFFSRIGFDIVMPPPIQHHEDVLRAESSFCQPVVSSHSSFVALIKKNCDFIFIPQIMQLPVPNVPTYSRLCPFIQGEPYYLKTTFRKEIDESGSLMLSPILRMEQGYTHACSQMVSLAVKMGIAERQAKHAYLYACEKQTAFEKELYRIGRKFLYSLEKDQNKTAIVLFGRPYNAFASYLNMGIPHKVASRGYAVIPFDMLPADGYRVDSKMFWAMGQKIMKAAQFVHDHKTLFGFYITNFSCGPDSFLIGYFRDAMGSKPSLTLELDQHTADAGIDTRIEAALSIIQQYRVLEKPQRNKQTYVAAQFAFPYVRTSEGKKIRITDPRVEVMIPSFGHMASEAVAAMLRGININARALPVLDKEGLVLGKRNTTCKECLPYIVNTGAFLQYLESRTDPQKVTLFVMATGGGPCRLGQYFRAFEQIIRKKKIPNAAMLTVTDENGYSGLGNQILLRAWQGIVLTDVLGDIRSMLRVTAKNREEAMHVLNRAWEKCVQFFEGKLSIRFSSLLKFLSQDLSRIPLKTDPANVPVISLVGEIFVRRDEFSRKDIVDYLENRGFMVRVAPIAEYICYSNYVVNAGLGERKFSLQNQLKMRIVARIQQWWERKIKNILAASGLYESEMIAVNKTIQGVNHLLNENFRGECILTVGLAMREILDSSCGVIAIGPFGCMYSRIAEAILKKEMTLEGKARMPGWKDRASLYDGLDILPFLSIETDGAPFSQLVEANLEAFILQAQRVHWKMMDSKGKKHSRIIQRVASSLSNK